MSSFNRIRTILYALLLLTASAALTNCKDEEKRIAWEVHFRLHIGLNLPQYTDLNVPGGIITVPDYGYQSNGLYVLQELATPGTYSAYDATCTRHLSEIHVTQRNGTTATCPHCKTEYQLLNAGISSDGNYQLHPYRTHQNGYLLVVYN